MEWRGLSHLRGRVGLVRSSWSRDQAGPLVSSVPMKAGGKVARFNQECLQVTTVGGGNCGTVVVVITGIIGGQRHGRVDEFNK